MIEAKIKSYIGFAVRMQKVTFGVDGIRLSKKRQHLIAYDATLAENSLSKLLSYAQRREIPIIKVPFSLGELLKRDNVKAVAIGDKSLAQAILAQMEVCK